MALIVQKFGGSSVANADRVRNVARIITETYRKGHSVVVVLSAQGDTTDDLIAKAAEINPHASKRERDLPLWSPGGSPYGLNDPGSRLSGRAYACAG